MRPPDHTRVNWPVDASASGSAQVGATDEPREFSQEPARQKAREGYPSHYTSLVWCMKVGGSGPPTPGVQPHYPAQFFPPYSPPLLSYFFSGTPVQNSDFLPLSPAHLTPAPCPFFIKRSPTPAPLTPSPCPPHDGLSFSFYTELPFLAKSMPGMHLDVSR